MKASLLVVSLLTVGLCGTALAEETVINYGAFTCYYQNEGDTGMSMVDPNGLASSQNWTQEQMDSIGRALQTWDELILNEPGRTITVGLAWSSSMPETALAGAGTDKNAYVLNDADAALVLSTPEQVWKYGFTTTSGSYDLYILCSDNFYDSFYYGFDPTQISSTQYDFESVMLHEIGHGLGFYSMANEDGTFPTASWEEETENGETQTVTGPVASTFDLLMEDSEGHSILNPGEEAFKIELGETLTLADSGLYVFNPENYMEGSSFSHVTHGTDSNADDQDLLMKYAISSGVTARELSEEEKTVMSAMGWQVATVPEPATATLSLYGLAVLLLLRRRSVKS